MEFIGSTHRMPNRNTNESKRYKVLHATLWSAGKAGLEKRTRLIVIVFNQREAHGKYAVRWQSYDGATFGGGSFNSEQSALTAMTQKVIEHNRSYPKGNISHLPGMV